MASRMARACTGKIRFIRACPSRVSAAYRARRSFGHACRSTSPRPARRSTRNVVPPLEDIVGDTRLDVPEASVSVRVARLLLVRLL